jgi:hypothetical protein
MYDRDATIASVRGAASRFGFAQRDTRVARQARNDRKLAMTA